MEAFSIVWLCLGCLACGLLARRWTEADKPACASCERKNNGQADPDLLTNAAMNVIDMEYSQIEPQDDEILKYEAQLFLIRQWNFGVKEIEPELTGSEETVA